MDLKDKRSLSDLWHRVKALERQVDKLSGRVDALDIIADMKPANPVRDDEYSEYTSVFMGANL
jgi:hypothetical protein